MAYCLDAAGGGDWTGWAWLTRGDALSLAALGPGELGRRLLARCRAVVVAPPLRCDSPRALLAASRLCLEGGAPELLTTGRSRAPGVRLGRGAVVHPTAHLEPPVYLGEDARVGPRAQLGPNACIGAGCLLDEGCTVADAIVLPGTFVGRQVELRQALADRDLLASAVHGCQVRIADAFLLGAVTPAGPGRWCGRLGSRLAAGALLCAAAPALAAAVLWKRLTGGRGVIERRPFLRLPAAGPAPPATATVHRLRGPEARGPGWTDLLHRVLPGLLAVVRGDLRLVGVEPRAPERVAAMPADWRDLYLSCEAGLISEALVRCGPSAAADEVRACDCLYAVRRGVGHDLAILAAYAGALWRRPAGAPQARIAPAGA